MKKFLLFTFSVYLFFLNIFAAEGFLNIINTSNTMSFKFKFEEAGINGKMRGWYKNVLPGKNRKIKLDRVGSAPDIKDFWLNAYDKNEKFLGTFKFTKNINIKNNETTIVKINWSLDKNIPIRYVYKPGTNDLDFKDFGEKFKGVDSIRVYNEAEKNIYVGTYRRQGDKTNLIGDVVEIKPKKSKELKKPSWKLNESRTLVFSYFKDNLPKAIKHADYKSKTLVGIGIINYEYYVAEKDFVLKGYTKRMWATRVLEKLNPLEFLKQWANGIAQDGLYSKKEAEVSFGSELSKQEKEFVAKRKSIVAKKLSDILNKTISAENSPIIACAHSGGGYRAMISSLGILTGLEEIGLLDTVTYLAGISGSTWCFTPFAYYQKSAKNYKELISEKVQTHIMIPSPPKNISDIPSFKASHFLTNILIKSVFGQHCNVIDFYGELLSKKLFGQTKDYKKSNVHLSAISKKLKDAKTPMPILTAISPGIDDGTGHDDLWFEFTPYTIGANVKDFYVPTWSFGRKFLTGKSIDFAPEQSIGFYMGIWGSAFANTQFKDMLKFLDKIPGIKNIINTELLGKQRLWPAKINNPILGLSDKDHTLSDLKEIKLVDAGEGLRFPIPPLLRRKPNIIILYDADSNKNAFGRSLWGMKEWAEDHGFKMPYMAKDKNELKEKILKNPVQIFESSNPKIPTIIYLAFLGNSKYKDNFNPSKEATDGFCKTLNFKYSEKDFNRLTGLMHSHVVDNKARIIDAINRKCEQLSN